MARIAGMLGVDAEDIESKTDPPPPAGDLDSEINAFTTIDACIDSRAGVDPLLGDALDALGYETFLSDACHVLSASKSRDVRRCAAIEASALRERCVATVAEVAGQPDACPWAIAGRPGDGRDPACLAIASRDGRLCAGVSDGRARAICEAVAKHDTNACRRLPRRAAQAQCLRSAARWATTIAAPPSPSPPLVVTAALTFSQTNEDVPAGPAATVDLGPDLQRGVVLVQTRDGRGGVRFAIGHPGADAIAPSPHVGASLALELFVPPGGAGLTIERAELHVPGHPPVATPIATSTLRAKLENFEPMRAGVLHLVVEGSLKDSVSSWRVHAELRAFVRDTVRSSDFLSPSDNPGERFGQ